MSLHNMYTCLGDDDPDFKTRGGLWFSVQENFEEEFWTNYLNPDMNSWVLHNLLNCCNPQFYNFRISAGILNKMNKTPGDHQFVTSKTKASDKNLE
jgi:hypothetical protein